MNRPTLEVGEIIRKYTPAFLDRYDSVLSTEQRRVLKDLALCRTAALGGHVERCLDCGHERMAYNSCRNRHCPKCQALSRARWLERESAYLLPVEYHHVVFTLPAELAELASANPSALYNLLMQSAAETLREVAANPQRLGAQIGVLMVLHTWGQNLHHHPHVHCVVTGGGLSSSVRGVVDASPRWVSCRPGFFLPVRVLSRVYRGKFLAGLRALRAQGKLRLPALLQEARSFTAWLSPLYAKEWVVYAKPPFGGPEQVLKYLARYTHRVAISNHRLVKLEGGKVFIKGYRKRESGFMRRFLQHVVPTGFMRIRHFGFLANRFRAAKLKRCRQLLQDAQKPPTISAPGQASALDTMAEMPVERHRCPHCGNGRMIIVERFERGSSPTTRCTEPFALTTRRNHRCKESGFAGETWLVRILPGKDPLIVRPECVFRRRLGDDSVSNAVLVNLRCLRRQEITSLEGMPSVQSP